MIRFHHLAALAMVFSALAVSASAHAAFTQVRFAGAESQFYTEVLKQVTRAFPVDVFMLEISQGKFTEQGSSDFTGLVRFLTRTSGSTVAMSCLLHGETRFLDGSWVARLGEDVHTACQQAKGSAGPWLPGVFAAPVARFRGLLLHEVFGRKDANYFQILSIATNKASPQGRFGGLRAEWLLLTTTGAHLKCSSGGFMQHDGKGWRVNLEGAADCSPADLRR